MLFIERFCLRVALRVSLSPVINIE